MMDALFLVLMGWLFVQDKSGTAVLLACGYLVWNVWFRF